MMNEIKKIEVMETVCQKMKVELKEISCFLLRDKNLHIRGGIYPNLDYKSCGDMNIRADVLSEEGQIIFSLEDKENRETEFLYDSFYMRSYGDAEILREYDLSKCKLRIYPINRRKRVI